eukprot:Gregarina_sp_Pseudo_9__1619@NODE_2090_length_1156_cov_608_038496_g1929_i0_p1_GENE_NODE_2090_length_1156_cov_608_038496_g1929_i0NODE_2090_length_1156_cov_608_038496_g1929_i0_p1_ORF_typecomplete_len192_score52_47Ribosomal_L6e/PF01159_19/1_2e04Ribosomal_L6e/PF01159_19/2_3e25LegC3_N/PF18654_1/0_0071_NODE_2090_length_1156_cov_608_038496_g1929_i070645
MAQPAIAQIKARVPRKVKASTIAKHASAVRKQSARAPRVKQGIVPGAVGIILTGPYAGKRVVILKALVSGFVAVTGPYEVNRVPLRRVHQKFLIPTSTVVDISKADTSKIEDALFKKQPVDTQKSKDAKKGKDAMEDQSKTVRSEALKAEAKAIDAAVSAAVKAVPQMEQYLKTRFSLTQTGGLKAHELQF